MLVGNRSEASHFAGSLVLNAPEDSARYSHDTASGNDVAARLRAPST